MLKAFLLIMMLFLVVSVANAQASELDRSRLNTAAFYNYSEAGDVTIKVHVWGAVKYPGLYEIPRNSQLSELISLAGGPSFGEKTKRSTRKVVLKLHRNDNGTRSVFFQTMMENQLVVEDADPLLLEGDVLSFESETRQGIGWRDIFPVVSMVATLLIVVDRFSGK